MYRNKPLSISLVALLLLSTVMVIAPISAEPAPPGEGAIWVEPSYVNGSQVGVGNTFIVEVKINISATAGVADHRGIYAFAFWLTWDTSLLTCTMAKITCNYPKSPYWSGGHSTIENKILVDKPAPGFNTHSYAETAMPFDTGFTGVMTLAKYNFTVASQPMWWNASCPLDITNRGFSDYDIMPIIMHVYDGLYEIKGIIPVKPKLYVDPPSIYNAALEPCENFTVYIKITDATDLYSFNFKLGFNKTILEATRAEEGPFLKSFGTTTVNNLEINNTEGYVWISVSLVTGGPAAGSGILANVTFHVIDVGECALNLYDTELTDNLGRKFPHDVSDGYFNNILMPRIFVDPPKIIDLTLVPPSKFSINVSIGNITNMYDYVFKLAYNTKILNCIGLDLIPFQNEIHFISTVSVNDPAGIISVNVTYFDPAPPITTIPPVAFATIKFIVTDLGISVFDLYDTHLSDPTGASISHETTDGYFVNIIRDVAVLSVKPSTTATYVGWLVNITVVARNEGDLTETFNVSAYYNDNLIGTKSVTNLPSKKNETLIFTWNTVDVQPCINYTIKAKASIVPYEINTANNEYVDGKVKIKMMGDIDGDGIITIFDVAFVSKAFGSAAVDDPKTPLDETKNWNPDADLKVNGIVDIFDVCMVAKYYGKHC